MGITSKPMQDQPGFFTVIPAPVRYDEHLADKAKLLYGEIMALSKRDGFCRAKNGYFARHFKVSNRAISKWMAQLQKRGHIHAEIIDGHCRKIWVGDPTKALPPANNGSWGVERKFMGGRTVVPPPIYDKYNNKENTHSGSLKSGIVQKSGPHPQREAFIALWSAAYEDFFEVSYKVQNGKDGRAADSLLALNGTSPEQLIELARKAWGRMEGFNCKHAISITGFASRFNEIRAEVGAIHNRSKTKGF